MKPRYKAHYGKSQPVADDVMVEVVYRDKHKNTAEAKHWRGWRWRQEWNSLFHIVAYRILEDEQ